MRCDAELRRNYPSREAAFRYLASRGFLCASSGWENGRWAATLEYASGIYDLRVWLRPAGTVRVASSLDSMRAPASLPAAG